MRGNLGIVKLSHLFHTQSIYLYFFFFKLIFLLLNVKIINICIIIIGLKPKKGTNAIIKYAHIIALWGIIPTLVVVGMFREPRPGY